MYWDERTMSLEADVYARPTYLPVALEAAIRALDDTAVELWLVGLRSLRQVEVNKIQSSTERVPALYLVLDRLMGIRHEFSDSLLRLPNIEVISIRRHDYFTFIRNRQRKLSDAFRDPQKLSSVRFLTVGTCKYSDEINLLDGIRQLETLTLLDCDWASEMPSRFICHARKMHSHSLKSISFRRSKECRLSTRRVFNEDWPLANELCPEHVKELEDEAEDRYSMTVDLSKLTETLNPICSAVR